MIWRVGKLINAQNTFKNMIFFFFFVLVAHSHPLTGFPPEKTYFKHLHFIFSILYVSLLQICYHIQGNVRLSVK